MHQLALLVTVLATLAARLTPHRRARSERGSISVEQVLITAGLVAITVGALAAIGAAVAKYASNI